MATFAVKAVAFVAAAPGVLGCAARLPAETLRCCPGALSEKDSAVQLPCTDARVLLCYEETGEHTDEYMLKLPYTEDQRLLCDREAGNS